MKVSTDQIKKLIHQIDHDVFGQNGSTSRVSKKKLKDHISRMLDSIQMMINVKKPRSAAKSKAALSSSSKAKVTKSNGVKKARKNIDKSKVIAKRILP